MVLSSFNGCAQYSGGCVCSMQRRLGLREANFALKVRDKSQNLSPPSNLRVEPMPSTTRRDTATWRPWDSSTGRNVLWMSKIRWIECLFCSSCMLCTQAHWVTTPQHTHLSLSMHSHRLLPIETSWEASLWFSKMLWYTHTQKFTLTTAGTWGENQLLWHFISLFAVAIETGLAGEDALRVCACCQCRRCLVHTVIFVRKIKSQKAFPHLFNQERAAGFPDCEWPVVWDQNTRLILTLGTWVAI